MTLPLNEISHRRLEMCKDISKRKKRGWKCVRIIDCSETNERETTQMNEAIELLYDKRSKNKEELINDKIGKINKKHRSVE